MSAAKKRRRSSPSFLGGRQPRAVVMPTVSWGRCRIYRCWVVGDLAAGLCTTHWDRGLDKHDDKRNQL